MGLKSKVEEARKALKKARQSTAGLKLIADWLEKFSMGAALIGMFQLFQAGTSLAAAASIILAVISGLYSFWLTLKLEREGE